MALTTCSECKQAVSDKASACPMCGAPRQAASRGIRPSFIILLLVFGGLLLMLRKMTGVGAVGAIIGPVPLFSERVVLDEGQARDYAFTNDRNRKIAVEATAQPRDINIVVVSDAEYANYNKARGNLFGGQFSYFPDLSAKKSSTVKKEGVLGEGRFHVIVERPRESIIFTDKTEVTIRILGY